MNKCTLDGEEGPQLSVLFSLIVTLSMRCYVCLASLSLCVNLHSWVSVGMTSDEFFLAVSQVTASPGGREKHTHPPGTPRSRGPSPAEAEPASPSPALGLGSEGGSKKRARGEPWREHVRVAP